MRTEKRSLTSFALIGGCLLVAAMILAIISQFENKAEARYFPPASAVSTESFTNSFSVGTNGTPATAQVNGIEFSIYHTFQAVVASTNAATFALDRSLDGANWTVVGTNTFSSPGGSGEQTMSGKWYQCRMRFYGSNATATVTYLGGR